MTMLLEVAGVQYGNFSYASCEIRLDALSNTFEFIATPKRGEPLPFKGGDSCKIIVNGNTVLTGYIEVIDIAYSATQHEIHILGRDKTGDLLDSNLDQLSDTRAQITLKQLIELVIENIGANLEVVDRAAPPSFTETTDLFAVEPGTNAFAFIEKYARKRQVLLTSNGAGDVVIEKGNPQKAAGSVQNIIGATDNNVISANFTYDTTGRYNLYKFASQLNITLLNELGITDIDELVAQSGGTEDNDIRAGRQLVLISESPYSNEENGPRAQWERNIRRARGLKYSVTVPGYGVDSRDPKSDLWQINRLYQVIDDYVGKSEPMLCNRVLFELSVDKGEVTTLGFVDETTYLLDLTKPTTSESADLVV